MTQQFQIQHSNATLSAAPTPLTTKRAAQLVVTDYIEAWYGHLTEREQIDMGVELIRLLGLTER